MYLKIAARSVFHIDQAILKIKLSTFWLWIHIRRPWKPPSSNFQEKFQRVNVNAHSIVQIDVKTQNGRNFAKKHCWWSFESWFWRIRVVLNDATCKLDQTNFVRPVHNLKNCKKTGFFEYITSNISKSWRDGPILSSDSDSPQKTLRKWLSAF